MCRRAFYCLKRFWGLKVMGWIAGKSGGVRYSAAIQEIAWIQARDKLHNSGILFLFWLQQALLRVTGECSHVDKKTKRQK
jgi:hypothetical protein